MRSGCGKERNPSAAIIPSKVNGENQTRSSQEGRSAKKKELQTKHFGLLPDERKHGEKI